MGVRRGSALVSAPRSAAADHAVRWSCSQCGSAGAVYASDATLFSRVVMDVENAHAAHSPECPFDRYRVSLAVEVPG